VLELYNINHTINIGEFLENHRKKPTDFTRNRTLTFPRLISFILNTLDGSIQAELVRFFNVIEIATYQQNQLAPLLFAK
jgi:hypothetical protein